MRQPSPGAKPASDRQGMKRYILWDHDGVLVDTEPLYFEATRRTIRELGVDLEHAAYLADMARGRSAWARLAERGVDPETIDHHRRERNRLYQSLLERADIAIPGVEEVLRQLSSDYAMAIVANDFVRGQDFSGAIAHIDTLAELPALLTTF